MIRKLQRRFIRIALMALTVAMVLVVLVVNAANWVSVRKELSETISSLSDDGGMGIREEKGGRMGGKTRHARNLLNESKWFSVSFDAEGIQRNMDLQNMMDPNEDTALALAEQVPCDNV